MPPLITAEQHALARELLARNSRLSPRNTRKPSLLQGISSVASAAHSYYRSSTRSKAGIVHHYSVPIPIIRIVPSIELN